MQLPQLKIGNLLPRLPIIQGGMALRVSTASLAAAVANAGGIGVIGATGMESDELREEIRLARGQTDGIIGVNIMFAIRNFATLVRTALEEKIDVIFSGAGFSRDIFGWGREAGVPVVSIVSSGKLAAIAEKYGAAAVVAEGTEAGGHLGTNRSICEILPEIRKRVKIPVIAAGGIVDGFGVARMLKLGADGVQMATRFVLSKECAVADAFKEMYLRARPEDVLVVESPVGMPGRALRNKFVDKLMHGTQPGPERCRNCLKACSNKYCIMDALENSRTGEVDEGLVFCGQNVFKIKEILSVKEIFQRIVREVQSVS
ncbi:NAD(P)H-dependent flavin oxidoreductase [Desulfoscipio geothermicus]|uniref:Probable nitronate monooxygenase n=1 Tax=Desulfoscipio geothermicus DSM 3669 TaxID=1121426 RepID=A0A1I6D1R0_9FIRM|nr:nitronate monooxygenase [Desulfoscipio geothermicus]SFQ99253.1 NAD(P)H-dependent flavin oxidoreductase YrpB, nitropropane dioxygenase family [Desulfoscipio geothermicus DSM 3669]